MPKEFWLIGYGPLVWDRSIMGFIPVTVLEKTSPREAMERMWFLEEAEAQAQADECRALGVEVEVQNYALSHA
jgi:hypothetical protein